jgi:hypothetical protein
MEILCRFGLRVMTALLAGQMSCANAQTYNPPAASAPLLTGIDFSAASPVDEAYLREFIACDGNMTGAVGKDKFRSVNLRLPNRPEAKQYYLCSRDPSNVRALLRLADGGILWQSKMALDVDGSWAAWNGLPGATDLKETAYKWPGSLNPSVQSSQIDPDRIPYVVMPIDGITRLSGDASGNLGREFASKTGLRLGDMGVAIYKGRWSPVLIADGGPFMRLGEGSSRLFEALGQSRCKKWSADGQTCIGPGGEYPYRNFGIGRDVIFVLYPGSRNDQLTPANAISQLCTYARTKLNLTGGSMCP